ncbi:MAG TPA: DNA adenine methylase [Rhodocyclaceae bacterium]|nr:DNA adenine methylase [Rhodocyclaceae bacterium]
MGYFGSKQASGAYQAIIAAMPPHDVYIESHLGGGAVMRFKPPAARSIGLDLDRGALDAFQGSYPVELRCADARSTIDEFDYAGSGRVLIYSDPPYLHETRTSNKRYRCEYTTEDHIELLETLKGVPAFVILSGYPSKLYDDLLPGWRTYEFQVMTRGGVRTEKLWMNFEPDSAHWATFAGKDFTDRQRIKRKAQRWAENFRELPPGERTAILAALLEVEHRA